MDRFPHLTDKVWIEYLSSIELRLKKLTLDDIGKFEDCQTFRVQFHSALRTALKWAGGNVSKVYVCCWWEKTMPVDAVLVSIAEGIKNIYHVIAPKISRISRDFADLVIGKKNMLNSKTKLFIEVNY